MKIWIFVISAVMMILAGCGERTQEPGADVVQESETAGTVQEPGTAETAQKSGTAGTAQEPETVETVQEPGTAGTAQEPETTETAQESEPPAEEEPASVKETVLVVSGGEAYIPVRNFTFSETTEIDSDGKEHVLTDCGAWLGPEDVRYMPQVPWTGDMRLEVTGEVRSLRCRAYDESFAELAWEADSLEDMDFLKPTVPYYVKAEAEFGDPACRYGYQYFFRVIPDDPSPELSVSTWENDGTATTVPAGKGLGALQAMVMGREIPYVPIGSRLRFSFGEEPQTVRIADMILEATDAAPGYWEERMEFHELTPEENSCYTEYVGTNMEAMKYWYADPYKPGGILRGFFLECEFDGGHEAYAVVFRTDAAFGVKEEPSSAYLMPMCGTGMRVFSSMEPKRTGDELAFTFRMDNVGVNDLLYDDASQLYRHDGEEFREILPFTESGWPEASHKLKKGKTERIAVDLEEIYGALEPGYYRFTKTLTDKKDGEFFTVSGDFILN